MRLEAFVNERANDWSGAEALLRQSKGRFRKLRGNDVLRATDYYRAISTDLAFLKQQHAGGPVIMRVSTIVHQLHRVLYRSPRKPASIFHFFTDTYWKHIMDKPAILLITIALMIIPAAAIVPWTMNNPVQASNVLGEQFRQSEQPQDKNGGFGDVPLSARSGVSTYIFLNNIRVTLMAFAGGMTLGIFTTYIYLFNAFMVGIFLGIAAIQHDLARTLSLVAPHGVLELSCIAVSAYAGYRMAWAFVHPGNISRAKSLTRESRVAVEIALGTAFCLIIAGLVEGLVTPADLGFNAKYIIGIALGAIYWSLVLVRGRRETSRRDTHELSSQGVLPAGIGSLSLLSSSKH